MKIAVLNHALTVSTPQFDAAVRAVQRQLDLHVAPAWGFNAHLLTGLRDTMGCFELHVLDNERQRAALVLDDTCGGRRPRSFVYANEAREHGLAFRIAQEAIALVGNPWRDTAVPGPNGGRRLVAYELCDPVFNQGYDYAGIYLPNFVLPGYFDASARRDFDFLAGLTAPFDIAPGCAQVCWNGVLGWYVAKQDESHFLHHPARRRSLLQRNNYDAERDQIARRPAA